MTSKEDRPVKSSVAIGQGKPVVKTPKTTKITVKVKLVRRLDANRFLVLSESGVFYIVSPDVFEPNSRTAEIFSSEHEKPQDWSKMLDLVLPSREEMIADACTHLIKNGMVVLSDLSDNAKRSRAFREIFNYSIPKPEDKE